MSKLILPKIIGHRGAAGYAPENTLVSFHTAADMGVEWVEFDVKLTKDHVPVIFHDDNCARCTGNPANIADLTLDEVKALDAGSWFSDSFVGEKIPTLEEALDVIIDRKLKFNMEIKPCPGREIETAEIALDIIGRTFEPEDDLPLISSFSHVSLETAMDTIPSLPRGLLIDDYREDWQGFAEHLKVSSINIDGNKATTAQIEEYLEFGVPVLAYTINEPMKALELFDLGVTSVFTDTPDVIMEEIETFN